MQLLPYMRTVAADPAKAIDRVERVAAALPAAWFTGGPPPAAGAFLELLHALAGQLQAQRRGAGGSAHAQLAPRLAAVLARLGDKQRADTLMAAVRT
jgi:hypothetical protein